MPCRPRIGIARTACVLLAQRLARGGAVAWPAVPPLLPCTPDAARTFRLFPSLHHLRGSPWRSRPPTRSLPAATWPVTDRTWRCLCGPAGAVVAALSRAFGRDGARATRPAGSRSAPVRRRSCRIRRGRSRCRSSPSAGAFRDWSVVDRPSPGRSWTPAAWRADRLACGSVWSMESGVSVAERCQVGQGWPSRRAHNSHSIGSTASTATAARSQKPAPGSSSCTSWLPSTCSTHCSSPSAPSRTW